MQKNKDYSELDITNSFIFSKVMMDEKLCKELLEIILGISILKIEYLENEKNFDYSPDSKSVRLDIYVNDDKGSVYDIEMQATDTRELPKRSRYYQSMIDISILEKGANYRDLKESYVIFICLSDIFGRERYVYTFRNLCIEDNGLELKDEATKIFLNPYGKGNISERLDEFFSYLREHKPTGQFTKELEESVVKARQNSLWRKEYMFSDMDRLILAEDCKIEGSEEHLISQICKKLVKGKSISQIADEVEEDEARVKTICDAAAKYAPDYDIEAIWNDLQ
ncbi:MAG: Rpn family recombination-promoting nuclease/putative transposase [Lachnospiraceae bacterium]|nr:Rpn family recombination-promoting nuclease/putative transposase [Lachnospiraceae bacterium]